MPKPIAKKQLATQAPKPAPIVKPPAEEIDPAILEKALIGGDLSALNPGERVKLYLATCASLKLNPLTRPFEYTNIDGKLSLYAKKDCTDQLRQRDGISITPKERKTEDGLHMVIVTAKNAAGREDESIGVEAMVEPDHVKEWDVKAQKKVWVKNPLAGKPLPPAERAKALMKAETKAKRRATLSLCGLGMPDESEIESIALSEAPQVIEQQREEVKQLAEKTEKADTAKVIEAGGKVETFQPDAATSETPNTEKVESSTRPAKEDWRKVKCHIGLANGPWLMVKVGDMVPAAFAELRKEWLVKLPESPLKKDAILRDACIARIAANLPEDAPQSPETPPEDQTTVQTPQKPAGGAPSAKAGPATVDVDIEKMPAKPIAWRGVVVNLPESKALHGLTLGKIADAKLAEIQVTPRDTKTSATCDAADGEQWLTLLMKQGIPKIETRNGGVKDQILINAIRAAAVEKGALDGISARKEIRRRFTAAGVSEEVANEHTKGATGGKTIDELDANGAIYLLQNWSDVEALIKAVAEEAGQ